MADLVTDPNDPRLGKGPDDTKTKQNDAYLVLSEEERAKGFVRPVRYSYIHVGPDGPEFPLEELDEKQKELVEGTDWIYYEPYPEGHKGSALGRYWSRKELDKVNNGCNTCTSMSKEIAETYARSPKFYGYTYCCGCQKHLPVNEFVWAKDETRVGS